MNTSKSLAGDKALGHAGRSRVPLWKRILDLTCLVIALPILVPVMLLIALLIKLVSRGPCVFTQVRIGHRGKPFICYKFRTMAVANDDGVHQQHLAQLIGSDRPMMKLDGRGDPRLIPGAWLLRCTGLDELPQVFNVVQGEMSLVGPRPCLPFEYERYLPWQKARFDAVPGLTGLWQVSGKNHTTFREMIELDIRYARTASLRLDLLIMIKTLPVLVVQTRETHQLVKSGPEPAPSSMSATNSNLSRPSVS